MEINRPGDLVDIANLGLTLAEAKLLLAGAQREIVAAQAREHAVRRSSCARCGDVCRVKDYRDHAVSTLFGQVTVQLPRFRCAACGGIEAGIAWPAHCRSTPELDRLQAHLSALMTYRTAADVLGQMFPVDAGAHHETLRRHTLKVGEMLRDRIAIRPEAAAAAIVVTLDSTFIRSRAEGERHLEVRVGNVETASGGRQVFGAVAKADTDIRAVICRSLDAVGRTEDTALTAFTDGCPGLRRILADAGVDEPSFSGRAGSAKVYSTLTEAVDRFARVGWLPDQPKRLAGQLCRAAPRGLAGGHRDHRRDGQLPGQPPDEQVTADALVATRCRSAAAGSVRCLQWHARFRLRTEVLPSQRSMPANGDRRLTPNLATVPSGTLVGPTGTASAQHHRRSLKASRTPSPIRTTLAVQRWIRDQNGLRASSRVREPPARATATLVGSPVI